MEIGAEMSEVACRPDIGCREGGREVEAGESVHEIGDDQLLLAAVFHRPAVWGRSRSGSEGKGTGKGHCVESVSLDR